VKQVRPQRRVEQGAASLAVVLVLFFIVAMVAAYTNRNLIFEQRTSANSYRSARALAAAEAGIDWAVAMLNGGAIDAQCGASSAPNDDFKTRYLSLKPDGSFAPVTWAATPGVFTGGPPVVQAQPACSALPTGGWGCSCPTNGPGKNLNNTNVDTPVFVVGFDPDRQRPGVAAIRVRGCNNVRSGTVTDVNTYGSCHMNDMTATNMATKAELDVDAAAIVRVSLGLVSALPVAPTAALTVGGNVTQMSGSLNASNPDPATGVALRAGGTITGTVNSAGPAGSLDNPQVALDAALHITPATEFFRTALGLPEAQYRQQPATMVCSGGCASLPTVAASNPTRVIFVEGDLNLSPATPMGTTQTPTMLVVTGNVTVSQAVQFKGVIFAGGNLTWTAAAANGTVDGAIIVGGNYIGNGNANITYDREVVRRIHKSYGSFVRIPGSWNTEN
jgi:hypothetical protein